MESLSRCFPYEKSIVINALYDTIDALGLSLDSSNSVRGTLIVSDKEHTGKMRIALDTVSGTSQTQVRIYPEDSGRSFAETWVPVVMDELTGRMKRVYHFERGEATK